jgi:hypothetical protein
MSLPPLPLFGGRWALGAGRSALRSCQLPAARRRGARSQGGVSARGSSARPRPRGWWPLVATGRWWLAQAPR